MVLSGHSLGGYLVTSYVERYPNIVDKLLLVSPAGVNERPSHEELKEKAENSGWVFSLIFKVWSMDVSPQGIARGLGPFGKKLISGKIATLNCPRLH
jgi:pimeloyl-ACP methyl ester carboxylesterase